MSEASAAPPPSYSTWPLWAVTVAYLLNLAVVLALQSLLLSPTVGMEYYRWFQIGAVGGLAFGASLWGWTTRFRSTASAPWAAPFLVFAIAFALADGPTSPTLGAFAGFLSSVGFLPLFLYVIAFPLGEWSNEIKSRLMLPKFALLLGSLIAAVVYTQNSYRVWTYEPAAFDALCLNGAFVGSVLFFFWCWGTLQRAGVEIFFEMTLGVCYSARGGPTQRVPAIGPVLVIANHACWFDPAFVAKVLPRPGTPMMTARFYSIWFIKPLLKYIFRVIVVPETPMRREAPELKLAVAALDRGECVMLFPEGYLRRKEEVPLRRFGQGVWQILKERPDTPVIACWVEGGWGAWCSYYNGPPTKNKRMDFRRKIRVSLSEPEVVPQELLADHLATRIYLMNRVRAMRVTLGLPDLPLVELPGRVEEVEVPE